MKKNERKIIPIFFAVDDKYSPYLCVALRSLIDNSSDKYDYRVNILIEDISSENRELLENMATDRVNIKFFNVSNKLKEICAKLHLRDYYTKATYYRFFIPEMFPEYNRGVYLDCDIILTDDVAKLCMRSLGDDLLAAANDEIIADIEVFARYSEDVLNISRYNYFNAGILVMNLEEMRRFEIEKRFAEILTKRTYRVAQDQDYLNKLCDGRVRRLPLCWNKTPMPDSNRNRIPKIAHYKINYKPWKYDNIPYGELFWEYAAKTPLYNLLLDAKNNYTESEKARDKAQYSALVDLALEEIEQEDNYELCRNALLYAEV